MDHGSLQVIAQPARGGHQNGRQAPLELFNVPGFRGAAKDDLVTDTVVVVVAAARAGRQQLRLVADLRGQLARGRQDEHANAPAHGAVAVVVAVRRRFLRQQQLLQRREQKGDRLARAGAGAAQHVPAGRRGLPRPGLNFRHVRELHRRGQVGPQQRVQVGQIGECRVGRRRGRRHGCRFVASRCSLVALLMLGAVVVVAGCYCVGCRSGQGLRGY